MEDLEKKLSEFKQHRLSRRADWKIRFQLYRIILRQKASSFSEFFNWRGLSINNAVLVAVLVIFVISSTSLYAYGSEQVTPGKALYPLKRTIEAVKNELSPTGAAKADNYNGLSSRRLEEALILSDHGKTEDNAEADEKLHNNISTSIDRAVENYSQSVENMDKINNEERQTETVDKLKISGDDKLRVLEEIEQNIDFEKNPELNFKINQAKEKIKERREYLDKNRNHDHKGGDNNKNFNKDEQLDKKKDEQIETENKLQIEEPEQVTTEMIDPATDNQVDSAPIKYEDNEADENMPDNGREQER